MDNGTLMQALVAGGIELLLMPVIAFVVKRVVAKRLDLFDEKREMARVEQRERHDADARWQEAVTSGMRSILRAKIVSEHRKAMRQGYYDLASREYLQRVRQSYHGLDGNDIGDQLYEEIMELPTHSAEDADDDE